MRSIWFVCCPTAAYPAVQCEILSRDAAAGVVRAPDLVTLETMLSAMSEDRAGVIIYVRAADADLERCEEALAGLKGASPVVVMLERLDPGFIARVFHAGASEVITAEGETHATENHNRAYLEERANSHVCPSGVDDMVSEGFRSPAASGLHRPPDVGAGAPRDPLADELDLDEPTERVSPQPDAWGKDSAMRPPLDHDLGSAPPRPAPAVAPSALSQTAPAFGSSRAATAGGASGRPAPVIAAISGRGGCGKSTIVASMAWCAARLGLRCAVLDLDLMFGNLYDLMGVEAVRDLAALIPCAAAGELAEDDIVRTSMRVCPGLSLWGPLEAPEQAELMYRSVDLLVETLRCESDVILIDTSTFWGDVVAGAVGASDRCLIIGDDTTSSALSAKRVIELAASIGVARTRMTMVTNRCGGQGCSEDQALRIEMAAAISSKARIADGGPEVAGMLAFGRLRELMGRTGPYADSVSALTRRTLLELGCRIDRSDEGDPIAVSRSTRRFRLPWGRSGGERP